jgi:hypothetical protein
MEGSVSMKILFFQAKCNKCGALFDTPLLSDFSYGEFIATSENGAFVAYLNALEEPSFKEIGFLFDKLFKKYGLNLNEISCFHFIVGKCSDMIEGQNMRIDIGPICPDCSSNNCDYNNLRMVSKREVEKLSFTSFTGLSDDEKNSLIKEYITQFSKL